MPFAHHCHCSYLKILAIILTVLTICFTATVAVQAAAGNTVRLRLVDANNSPVSRISLSAWQVNGPSAQATVYTGLDGTALLTLPPGKYYFTGDITNLKARAIYTRGLHNTNETTFYFISKPVVLGNKPENIVLTIDSADYINIVDIAKLQGFQLHISQKELGITANIRLGARHNSLRLYLPLRKEYIIQQVAGLSHMQWPIYATPGSQFILPY
ncbi:hypothetical protein [Sporomusa aerivorans]|uniref:hypothetical protein n=1 Tax=Sporomusa aerivorans TaxID=204936 RepID=UPI00352B6B5A